MPGQYDFTVMYYYHVLRFRKMEQSIKKIRETLKEVQEAVALYIQKKSELRSVPLTRRICGERIMNATALAGVLSRSEEKLEEVATHCRSFAGDELITELLRQLRFAVLRLGELARAVSDEMRAFRSLSESSDWYAYKHYRAPESSPLPPPPPDRSRSGSQGWFSY